MGYGSIDARCTRLCEQRGPNHYADCRWCAKIVRHLLEEYKVREWVLKTPSQKKQQLIKETRYNVSLGSIVETADEERVRRPKLPKKRVLKLQRRKKK